jgi:hypothetical protein
MNTRNAAVVMPYAGTADAMAPAVRTKMPISMMSVMLPFISLACLESWAAVPGEISGPRTSSGK